MALVKGNKKENIGKYIGYFQGSQLRTAVDYKKLLSSIVFFTIKM
jgi:hypothetical protein